MFGRRIGDDAGLTNPWTDAMRTTAPLDWQDMAQSRSGGVIAIFDPVARGGYSRGSRDNADEKAHECWLEDADPGDHLDTAGSPQAQTWYSLSSFLRARTTDARPDSSTAHFGGKAARLGAIIAVGGFRSSLEN